MPTPNSNIKIKEEYIGIPDSKDCKHPRYEVMTKAECLRIESKVNTASLSHPVFLHISCMFALEVEVNRQRKIFEGFTTAEMFITRLFLYGIFLLGLWTLASRLVRSQ